MKIALYVAALCSMILFNSPALAACVQGDLTGVYNWGTYGSGVSSGPRARPHRGSKAASCHPPLHSPNQYASSSGPGAHLYRGPRAVSCRFSLRSPGQYTSPSGPGAGLYQGPVTLACDPFLRLSGVHQAVRRVPAHARYALPPRTLSGYLGVAGSSTSTPGRRDVRSLSNGSATWVQSRW